MFTSIIEEFLGTEIAECNEICQTLFDNEYESSNISSEAELKKVFLVISIFIIYNTHLSTIK